MHLFCSLNRWELYYYYDRCALTAPRPAAGVVCKMRAPMYIVYLWRARQRHRISSAATIKRSAMDIRKWERKNTAEESTTGINQSREEDGSCAPWWINYATVLEPPTYGLHSPACCSFMNTWQATTWDSEKMDSDSLLSAQVTIGMTLLNHLFSQSYVSNSLFY